MGLTRSRPQGNQVQTTATQLNLQPRHWICCQWASGGKRKDPRGGKGLCRSLEAPEGVGCTPASFSKVTKWATTCFPQWESEQSLLSVTALSAAIIYTSYTTVSLSQLSFILVTKGGAFTSEHQKTTQGFCGICWLFRFWWQADSFPSLSVQSSALHFRDQPYQYSVAVSSLQLLYLYQVALDRYLRINWNNDEMLHLFRWWALQRTCLAQGFSSVFPAGPLQPALFIFPHHCPSPIFFLLHKEHIQPLEISALALPSPSFTSSK